MERIKLITSAGQLVGYMTITPLQIAAKGVLFGSRAFFLDREASGEAIRSATPPGGDSSRMLVYREGLMMAGTDFLENP